MEVIQASADLVLNVLSNVGRLLDDVMEDGLCVVGRAGDLGLTASENGAELKAAIGSSPRIARIIKDVLLVVGSYRLHRAKFELLDATPTAQSIEKLHQANADRLYKLCVDLRGALIKVGQFASARLDLLPPAYIEVLSQLQDRVPPVPTETIVARIEEELGADLADLFGEFDDEPIAAASLAQVHGAVLADGTEVAVKVQLPGIEDTVAVDLAAFRLLSRALSQAFPQIDLVTVADELSRAVVGELDYCVEAASATTCRAQFEDRPEVAVPVIVESHSARRVLTMERFRGRRLVEFLDNTTDSGRRRILGELIHTYCAQIMDHGLFQADPHPGNFLVLPAESKKDEEAILGLLDFGCTMRFPAEVRRAYAELAGTIVTGDTNRMAELLDIAGFRTTDGTRDQLVLLAERFLDLFREDLGSDFTDMDPQDQLEKALKLAREIPVVSIPQDFVLLSRVFATLGGLMLKYKPSLSLYNIVLPYLARAMTP
jgi:ubiquinone biosynthesis protein